MKLGRLDSNLAPNQQPLSGSEPGRAPRLGGAGESSVGFRQRPVPELGDASRASELARADATQVQGAELVHGHPEVGECGRRFARTDTAIDAECVAAGVALEEWIGHLDHELPVRAVAARGQRRRHVEQPGPEQIRVAGDPQRSRVGEPPSQRLVHRASPRLHCPHEVDVENEAPERTGRIRRNRDEVPDVDHRRRHRVLPLRVHVVPHVTVDVPLCVLVDGMDVVPWFAIGAEASPPAWSPGDRPRPLLAPAFVNIGEDLVRRFLVHDGYRVVHHDAGPVFAIPRVDLERVVVRRSAVPEAAVDDRLRRDEDGERLPTTAGFPQLARHEFGQQAPPPVRCEDADTCDAGDVQLRAARHGELEQIRVGRPDDLVAVEDGEAALRTEVLPHALDPVVIGRREAHRAEERPHEGGVLVQRDRPDVHQVYEVTASGLRVLVVRTLVEQADAVRRREVSPVELVERTLSDIERVQPSLNAFTHTLADEALVRAKELQDAEPLGPLHGVPVAVKELYDVAGAPTTGCCAAYADRIAKSDSAVVQRLRAAGAIVVVKTNQHELACGATSQVSSFGPVFNAWGQHRLPGGSSGGSGAAVAAGVVALAMGSDTGGSIRIPSSFCGVTGLKPTHGAVSLRGAMPMSPSFDTGGPLAVSALDCALVHSLIAGLDRSDPWSLAADQAPPVETLAGIRVGIIRSYLEGIHIETRAGVEAVARAFEQLGAGIVEVEGLSPWDARQRFLPVLLAEVADCYRDLWDDDRVSVEIGLYIQGGRSVSGADYFRSRTEALAVRNEFLAAFEHVDALLAPTTAYPAPRVDDTEVSVEGGTMDVHFGGPAALTMPVNGAGLPSLAFPVGFSSEDLPHGAQLIGPPWADLRLCSIVGLYQRATDWHLRRPS